LISPWGGVESFVDVRAPYSVGDLLPLGLDGGSHFPRRATAGPDIGHRAPSVGPASDL
jgi:hypothetical protein